MSAIKPLKTPGSLLWAKANFHQASNFLQQKEKSLTTSQQEALLILWTLGAGKTTLLTDLAHYLKRQGTPFTLIVNDIGKFNVDANRLGEFDPIQLTQGCICCDDLASLAEELKKLKESGEMILIEPTGIADGKAIKSLLAQQNLKAHILTLVNAAAYPQQSPAIQASIATQAHIADVLALTHLPAQEEVKNLKADFNTRFPEIPVVEAPFFKGKENLSKNDDQQFAQLLSQIRDTKGRKPRFQYANPQLRSAHQAVNTQNQLLPAAFWAQHLQQLTAMIGENLLRMKGVIKVWSQFFPFDYVKGRKEIEFGTTTSENPHITLISETPLDSDILEMLTNPAPIPQLSTANIPEKIIFSPIEVAEKVNILLRQYKDYMDMDSQKANLTTEYNQTGNPELAQQIDELTLALNQLGDEMKFDNPLIWLGYKKTAYEGTSKQVKTIADLLKHCERKTDICYKRLDFLNTQLKSKHNIDLFDGEQLDVSQDIVDFIRENPAIRELSRDEAFMQEWMQHEYFTMGEKVAKWVDYSPRG